MFVVPFSVFSSVSGGTASHFKISEISISIDKMEKYLER